MVSLILASLSSQVAQTKLPDPVSIRYAVLVSGRNPSKELVSLLGESSAEKLKKKAAKLEVVLLENDKWIVLVAPSAACPPSQARYALFEAAGSKFPFRLRIGDVPRYARESVEVVLSPLLAGLPKSTKLDDVMLESKARALIDFRDSKTGIKETLTRGIASEERGVDDLPAIKVPEVPQGAQLDRIAAEEPEQAICYSVGRSVPRALLHRAVHEAGALYESWFDKRWSKVEALFRDKLTDYFGKDPILASIGVLGSTDWDSLDPRSRKQMLAELKKIWSAKGVEDADIEARLQSLKYLGGRSYLMVRIKLTDKPFPQGVGTSIFSSPLGPP